MITESDNQCQIEAGDIIPPSEISGEIFAPFLRFLHPWIKIYDVIDINRNCE